MERAWDHTSPCPRTKLLQPLGPAHSVPLPEWHAPSRHQPEGLCCVQHWTPLTSPRLDTPPGSPLALSAMRTEPSHGLTDEQGEGVPGMSAGQMHRFVLARLHSKGGFHVRPTHSTRNVTLHTVSGVV